MTQSLEVVLPRHHPKYDNKSDSPVGHQGWWSRPLQFLLPHHHYHTRPYALGGVASGGLPSGQVQLLQFSTNKQTKRKLRKRMKRQSYRVQNAKPSSWTWEKENPSPCEDVNGSRSRFLAYALQTELQITCCPWLSHALQTCSCRFMCFMK